MSNDGKALLLGNATGPSTTGRVSEEGGLRGRALRGFHVHDSPTEFRDGAMEGSLDALGERVRV